MSQNENIRSTRALAIQRVPASIAERRRRQLETPHPKEYFIDAGPEYIAGFISGAIVSLLVYFLMGPFSMQVIQYVR